MSIAINSIPRSAVQCKHNFLLENKIVQRNKCVHTFTFIIFDQFCTETWKSFLDRIRILVELETGVELAAHRYLNQQPDEIFSSENYKKRSKIADTDNNLNCVSLFFLLPLVKHVSSFFLKHITAILEDAN
jgi:hypothetical protein